MAYATSAKSIARLVCRVLVLLAVAWMSNASKGQHGGSPGVSIRSHTPVLGVNFGSTYMYVTQTKSCISLIRTVLRPTLKTERQLYWSEHLDPQNM